MLESHRVNGQWTKPTVLPFSGLYTDSDPTLSPDGSKMFWTSDRPVNGKIKHDYDIWMVERTPSGKWSEAKRLPDVINSDASEFAASMTRSGMLYYSSAHEGGIQAFRTKLVNGSWTTPENVTRLINRGDTTAVYDLDVMIDPDERFLLLGSYGRREGFGSYDIYASWNENGTWTPAVHLPAPFNTRARDYAPHLSPDGRTLYFSSERGFALQPIQRPLTYRELTDSLRGTLNGSGNIYSIGMDQLESLRPSHSASAQCAETQRSSFAWWVGSWNYSVPGFDPGVTTVAAKNGGCGLQEEFVDRGGQEAHTSLEYDVSTGEWRRVVVDPFRTYNSAGKFASDGSIAFYETPTDRESYRPVDNNHVRFVGEKSDDNGKTWRVLFDATFTRRP
jgi:hypothetical protein